jgi:hypothetical protein
MENRYQNTWFGRMIGIAVILYLEIGNNFHLKRPGVDMTADVHVTALLGHVM